MGSKTVRTQVYLTEEQHQYLHCEAAKQNISMAEVLRKLIAEKLPQAQTYRDNPLFDIGKSPFSMGQPQGSSDHDQHIYRSAQ